MRSDRARRLAQLERGASSTEEGHARTAAWLDQAHADFAHLVDMDLIAELHATPYLGRAGVIARWIEAVATADPAAGATVINRLEQAA